MSEKSNEGTPEELLAMIDEYIAPFDIRDKCSQQFVLLRHSQTCIRRLLAELEAAKRDAERYRWLRENVEQVLPFISIRSPQIVSQLTHEYADAAIDAAMLAESERRAKE